MVEQAEDDLLAEERRQHGDAEVHLGAVGQLQLDAAVLRQAALGDVELRHDLHARGDGVRRARGGGCMTSYSTPSMRKRTRSDLRVGLDVDVAGPAADGLGEERVDEPDDRRLLVAASGS